MQNKYPPGTRLLVEVTGNYFNNREGTLYIEGEDFDGDEVKIIKVKELKVELPTKVGAIITGNRVGTGVFVALGLTAQPDGSDPTWYTLNGGTPSPWHPTDIQRVLKNVKVVFPGYDND